jgi:Protein of unknown function (DUF3631)
MASTALGRCTDGSPEISNSPWLADNLDWAETMLTIASIEECQPPEAVALQARSDSGNTTDAGDPALSPPPDLDRTVEIESLAALDPINYEVARGSAAQRLGFRASVLDNEVKKKRRALGLERAGDGEGQGRAVKIIDVLPWHELVSGDLLATALTCAIKNYVLMRDEEADAIAIWILHTWLVNDFAISPRLAITSPTKGCGKTTLQNVLGRVVRRPKRAGSVTPAALFRLMELHQPTLLLDEQEKYLEAGSEMHALLNEGHTKGATVLRVLGEQHELREFAVYGAVAFARNGKMPDDLEQRSIVVELQRRKAEDEVDALRPDKCGALDQLARMAARWTQDHQVEIATADPDMRGLINRVADNWRPLFAIAEVIGGDWPSRILAAAQVLAPREPESIGPMVLADIKVLFDSQGAGDKLSSEGVCEKLAEMEGRPWAEFGKARRPISKNRLARILKDFKIVPDNVRVGDRVVKGYLRHQFEDAWASYLAPVMPRGVNEPLHRYNADEIRTSATFQIATGGSDVAVGKFEKRNNDGHCSGVAVGEGGRPGEEAEEPHICTLCGAGPNGRALQFCCVGDQAPVWLHDGECQDRYMAGLPP